MKRFWLCFGLLSTSFACSDPQSEDKARGKVHVTIKPTGKPANGSLLDAAADFRNTAVASGAPESLTLYVKSMTLKNEDGVSYTLFYQSNGRAIRVGSKTADISSLFTSYACLNAAGAAVEGIEDCPCGLDADQAVAANADGTCPDLGQGPVGEVEIEANTFTSLQMEFFVTAKAKGCVTGDFTDVDSINPATQGVHTYCTKAAAHTFQTPPGVAAASELEGTPDTAEDMYYQIHPSASGGQTFTLNFPLHDQVIVEKNADNPPLITMLIDTNRLLRFYNQNKTQAPKTGWPADRAYFFNTVLDESTFVLTGYPGAVRGFQWWTEACPDNATGALCTGDTVVVAGWMTVIKGSDQEPIAVGFMPDDDDAITLIKGSNKLKEGLDRSAFARREAGYDIGFVLDDQGVGAIGQVNLDADPGSTQTSVFIGLQNYGGKIYLRRSL